MAELYITIGRQFGSGGREIGHKVAEALGIAYYDKELLAVAAKESGLSHQFLESYDEKPTNSFLYSLVMGQQSLLMGGQEDSVEQMAAKTNGLEQAVVGLADAGDVGSQAAAIRDTVLPKMSELRLACDEAETLTAKKYWPFPTYGDLLFGVR